jgi:hypothetical protein
MINQVFISSKHHKEINIVIFFRKILIKIVILGILMMLLFHVPSIFAVPYGSYQSENFKITNMTAIYKGKYIEDNYEILGIIENIGNETSSEIHLIATIFDKKNNLIGVYETIPILDISKKGNDSPFRFDISTNSSSFDHFNIEIGGK